jgi:hypothetical protein
MEKVTGIGGLFFRAHPKALGSWYQQHLGVSLTPSSEGDHRLGARGRPHTSQTVENRTLTLIDLGIGATGLPQ